MTRLTDEQLRDMAKRGADPGRAALAAMATELLALRAERAKLEAALRWYAENCPPPYHGRAASVLAALAQPAESEATVERATVDELLHALTLEQAQNDAKDMRRKTALSYGACPSCLDGAPDHYGCSDCLNTGYVGGAPIGFVNQEAFDAAQKDAKDARALLGECLEVAWVIPHGALRDRIEAMLEQKP